ncbi:hypothetical protein PIB30_053297 [Stylosanthes scabra]|uniref:Uncharacterized protein n=1 Tax=Stylosanthes scabra TaxID=79078 RepID=A0ABU6VGX1_9FABA|nr:hypothetical protein [Stylosanthes scabra]
MNKKRRHNSIRLDKGDVSGTVSETIEEFSSTEEEAEDKNMEADLTCSLGKELGLSARNEKKTMKFFNDEEVEGTNKEDIPVSDNKDEGRELGMCGRVLRTNNERISVGVVYGPNSLLEQEEVLKALIEVKARIEAPSLIFGDFNEY